ncbi:MAG TPA: carboxypeptidase regulatory-like domain-containing protein, partial [Thermoanaerobaculia bacterium]|nr:carboxypeptidase regulatory-like domain-containing protein [Thermoanaerobaculia bacterium]
LTRAPSLTGRVIDAESRRPVAGAVVLVSGRPEVWTLSDGAGAFTLERVPAAARVRALRAAAPGYLPAVADAGGSNVARPTATLALRPSAALLGSVTDQKGRPVAGVEVDAVAMAPRTGGMQIMRRVGMMRGITLKARTDERGRYRIAPLVGGVPHDVTFRRAGYAPLSKQVPPAPRDRPAELHVTLLPGSRGAGRVTTLQGQAIAGARVKLTKQEEGGGGMVMRRLGERAASDAEATTDAGGRFTLADLPAGRFELDVTAAGFAGSKVPGIEVPAAAGEVDLGTIKLAGGSPVEGQVVGPQGQPIEGAEVFVLEGMMGMMPLSRWAVMGLEPAASTAGDGFFRLADRAAGQKVDLAVRRSGYTVERSLGILAPTGEPVVITLRPASAIRGRVVNAEGDPVAEAQLQLIMERAGGGMAFMTSLGNTTTGDDGRFAIEDVDPGDVRINVNAIGYLPFERAGVEVPAGKDVDGLELVLRPGATVVGTVTGPDGLPAIGAYVSVVSDQRGGPMRTAAGYAETDGEGRYRLEGVEPGPRTLEAQHEELDRAVADLEVRAGENQLDLRLGGGQEVSGRVVGPGGQPVGSASVSLGSPGQLGGSGRGAVTDAGGLFTITGVPDGTYEAMATHADYGDGRAATPLTVAGAPVSGVTIELPVGTTVVGALRGLSMAEVARTQVWASQQQGPGRRQGTVSYDGRYQIAGLVPGDWSVSGRLQEGGRQAQGRVTIAAGVEEETLDLDFEGGFKLSGRVREDGRAAAGAMVLVRGKDVPGTSTGRTDQTGVYRVENLRPGSYDVEVVVLESGLRGNQAVTLERDHELDFDLRATRVSGRVLEAGSGDPIPGASISVEAVNESAERLPFRGNVSTDEGGRFSVNVSSDGAWKLGAEKAGYARSETLVDVGRDPVDDVEIRLSPTQGITLQVSRTAGAPPASVFVAVLHGHGGTLLAQPYSTGEGGRVRLTTVPPGTWEVLVRSEDSGTERVTVTSPGPPVPVLLAPQASLALTVPDLAGEAVTAKATLTGGDGRPFASINWSTVRREFDVSYGRITLTGLPAGTWKVDVVAPDGRRWSGSAVTAPGATASVELD